jgi:hypothetical protein
LGLNTGDFAQRDNLFFYAEQSQKNIGIGFVWNSLEFYDYTYSHSSKINLKTFSLLLLKGFQRKAFGTRKEAKVPKGCLRQTPCEI